MTDKNPLDGLIKSWKKSENHNIITDLDKPALKVSKIHLRTIGWWYVEWIEMVKDELAEFFKNDGKMKLIIGVPFSETSFDVLHKSCLVGDELYRIKLRDRFFEMIENEKILMATETGDFFIGALASQRLEVRLRPEVKSANYAPTHDKVRIYINGEHTYCLVGSSNDSKRGHFGKVDTNITIRNWSPDESISDQANELVDQFNEEWIDDDSISLNLESIEKLSKLKEKYLKMASDEEKRYPEDIKMAKGLAKKFRRSKKKLIFYSNRDSNLIEEMRIIPIEEKKSFEFLSIDDGILDIKMVFFEMEKIQSVSLFGSNESLGEIQDASAILRKKNSDFYINCIEKDCIDVWKEIFERLDISHENFDYLKDTKQSEEIENGDISNEEVLKKNDYWDSNKFQYVYLEKPGDLDLCKHQSDALDGWINNNHKGIFEHATGTYKTATGLCAAANLITKEGCKVVIITTPFKQVSRQWYDEARKLFKGIPVIPCWSEFEGWKTKAESLISAKVPSILIFVDNSLTKIVGNYNWACSNLSGVADWGIIIDECHNWVTNDDDSSKAIFVNNKTITNCKYRLGLSAKFDKYGVQYEYRNEIVKKWLAYDESTDKMFIDSLTLENAIKMGFLRKYHYEVVLIEINIDDNMIENNTNKYILNYASREFERKKEEYASKEAYNSIRKEGNDRLLIYTGNEIKDCVDLIGKIKQNRGNTDTGLVEKFTSNEGDEKRKQILNNFKNGIIKILVSIKCLDEGVNLPIADVAMLIVSNSEDDRQWIQRRGRILRKVKGEDKTAVLIDFLPKYVVNDSETLELLQNERAEYFRRVREFGLNSDLQSIKKLREMYKQLEKE